MEHTRKRFRLMSNVSEIDWLELSALRVEKTSLVLKRDASSHTFGSSRLSS